MRAKYEVADVLRLLGDDLVHLGLNTWQLRTLSALKQCRTAALGGHIDACDSCGVLSLSYNSCRNRHCPKCQGKNREDWIAARSRDLLPVPYFHLVFTLPEVLNGLALQEPRLVYTLLFEAAWETLQVFGQAKGLRLGMTAVLHTWGQNLSLHPHLHAIVPGGGLDKQGQWKSVRADGKFLFPVKAMSKVFRAKYCQKLQGHRLAAYRLLRHGLWRKPWVVYAKRPFGGPAAVLEYLGRYSHKVAISNHRLVSLSAEAVCFSYKDYRQAGQSKLMRLSPQEFIRRFALHILPRRFVKIRHYGFLSSTWKRAKLKQLQTKLGLKPKPENRPEPSLPLCRCCGQGRMQRVAIFHERGPPIWLDPNSTNSPACQS